MQFNTNYQYFYEFLKREHERTRSDFNYLKSCKCRTCGSNNFEEWTCIYCQNKDIELKLRIRKLDSSLERVLDVINKLGIKEIPKCADYFNELCELLISSKILFDKSGIESLLKKIDYKSVLAKSLKEKIDNNQELNYFEKSMLDDFGLRKELINPEIIEKIMMNIKLNEEEIVEIEKLLSLGLSDLEEIFIIANYVISATLLNKERFSYKTFEQAFLQVLSRFANEIEKGTVCTIEDSLDDENPKKMGIQTIGIHSTIDGFPKISILKEMVTELYISGKPLVLETMFHELTHLIHDKEENYPIPTKIMMLRTFDKLLERAYPDYYSDNYESLSHEIECRIEGYAKYKLYLESIGVEKIDEYDIYLKKEKEIAKYESDLRKIDSKEVDIELLFNDYIKDKPNLLFLTPILNCKYKVVPSSKEVVLKDEEELKNDFNNLLKEYPEYIGTLRELYEYLFLGLKKQEQYLEEQRQNETSNKKS